MITNPMWNQDWFTDKDYDADELGRFPAGAGFPGKQSADWGTFEVGGQTLILPDEPMQVTAYGHGGSTRYCARSSSGSPTVVCRFRSG